MVNFPVKVGDRIQLAEYAGTVRFIGELQNRVGQWVGIEWEDEFRGKHDGTVDSIRYFQTKNGEATGSFVSASTFLDGCEVVVALKSRYRALDAYEEDDMFVPTTTNKSKRIELVGLDKIGSRQKETQLLTTADLSGACIDRTGSLEELSRTLSGLEELNIAFNLIRDWQMIVELLSCLPRLSILRLSGNRFLRNGEDVEAPSSDFKAVSEGLKTLILNECDISWDQAASIAAWFPRLAELQVCKNNISTLSIMNEERLQHLQAIDFSFNQIVDWNEICYLSHLPNLKKMNLTANPLKTITYEEGNLNFFDSLECLLLGDCSISGWESVAALNRLPSLKETRLTGNPLMHNIQGGGRFEIVARVGGLVHLNGSKVSNQERTDCERRYISHVANVLIQHEPRQRTAVLAEHPRYTELIDKHGEPTTNVAIAKQTGALRENIVAVELICHAPSAGNKMGSQTKNVSLNMTLGTLRTLIEKIFALPKNVTKLYLKVDYQEFPEDISDVRDDRRLKDLYITDGQQILVNE